MSTEVILGYVSLVLGIISLIAGFIFYRLSLRKKEPCWAINSNNLIQGLNTKLDNLKISYKDYAIENLTVSRVLFWNNGSETIERSDIETVQHLRLTSKEGITFLDGKIIVHNNDSSQCNVKVADDKKCIFLDFDYLNHKQGFVIQVVHTGTSSKDIDLIGDIKGVKKLRNMNASSYLLLNIMGAPDRFMKRHPKITNLFSLIFGIALIFYAVIGLLVALSSNTSPQDKFSQILLVLLFSSMGFLIILFSLTSMGKFGLAPKGLEMFQDEWFNN